MEKSRNFFSSCAHRCALAIVTAVFAAFFAFAPTSEAEAGQFELGAGFGWLGEVDNNADLQGFHFVITPGYRILDWVGVYLDEGFGGLFMKKREWNKRLSWFAGQTIVNAKFFFPVGPVELWLKGGIGAFYWAYDWDDAYGFAHAHDSWGAFAHKLGFGVTYDVTSMIGIGGNFDYLLAAGDGNDHSGNK